MEIKQRDRGYEVVDIQQRLVALGYDVGPTKVDGFFGPNTETAVKRFQTDRKLPLTGIVNETTWRLMVDATYRFGSRALYLRSPFIRGDDVRQLQTWLNSIGFRTEPIDGVFGPSTDKAVREFQENVELTSDGIVGPSTLAALTNLRSILDSNHESVFSDILLPDSVVGLLQDRRIAIGSPTPHKHDWLGPGGNQQLVCADLAHRLSNLLEILGAQIDFFKTGAEPAGAGELALTFEPAAGKLAVDRLGIAYDHRDADSRKLAELIIAGLRKAMKDQIKEYVVGDLPGPGRPAASIIVGDLTGLASGANLKKDVFRQKIAGAVFDGLKDFIASKAP